MIGEAWVSDLADPNEPVTIAHFADPNGAALAEAFVAGLEYLEPDRVHAGGFAIDVDQGEADERSDFWERVRQNDNREFDASGKAVVTEED